MPTVYRVQDGALVPLWSTSGTFPPEPPVNSPPSAVGSLTVEETTPGTVTLSWTAATDSDGVVASYRVALDGGSPVTVAGLTYTWEGLAPETTYEFTVWAVDDDGAAGPVSSTEATTLAEESEITHGSQITAVNTGHTAYFDAGLGRYVSDDDLTVHNSLVSMSDFVANGGTLTRRWFKGGLVIDREGVTLVACRVPYLNNASTSRSYIARWCTIDTDAGSASDHGLGSWSYEAYRCKIGGSSDGLRTNGGVVATECYVRVKGQSGGDHNDGVQNYAGGGAVTIRRCNIDCRPTNGIGAPNAALFCADGATGLQTWHDNWLAGGAYVIRCYESATYDVQGNQVLQGSYSSAPAHRAVIEPSAVTWGTERSNVVVNSDGDVVSTISAP